MPPSHALTATALAAKTLTKAVPTPSGLVQSRLYRLRYDTLTPSFFSHQSKPSQSVSTKYFFLVTRRLPDDVVQAINDGPSWLRGRYDPGLLQARHEKLRLINYAYPDTWRDGTESEEDHRVWVEQKMSLSTIRIPVLQRNNRDINLIPTLIIASKKRVDKSAVRRKIAGRKVWTAFDQAVKQLEGTTYQIRNDSTLAYVFTISKDCLDASVDLLTTQVRSALERLVHKRDSQSGGSSKRSAFDANRRGNR